MIIAAELGAPLRITSGPAIERAGDLAAVLSTLGEGEVVFIDEIHRVARPAEEMLYLAMEDFRVDVVVGKGPGRDRDPAGDRAVHAGGRHHPGRAAARAAARQVRLHRAPGLLRARRAGVIVRRSAGLLGVALRDDGADEIAGRSRGTPRIANRLLRRVRDFAEVRGDGVVTREVARAALELYEVDERALTGWTGRCSAHWSAGSAAARSGCPRLAVAVGEEAETVEVVAEPFLVRAGLMARTPRGRVATPPPGSTWASPRRTGRGPGPARPGPLAAEPGERCSSTGRIGLNQSVSQRHARGRAGGFVARMSRSSQQGGHSLLVRHPCAAKLRQLAALAPSTRTGATQASASSTSPGAACQRKEAPQCVMLFSRLRAPASPQADTYLFLVVIVVLFALLYFVMIRPQRNRQRRRRRHSGRSRRARRSAPRPACTGPW